MNSRFLNPLSELPTGIEKRGNKYFLAGEAREPKRPIATTPIRTLKSYVEKRSLRERVKGIRVSVTGPFTLSSKIEKEGLHGRFFPDTLLQEIELVKQIAPLTARIARFLQEEGATIISISEPILSVITGKKFLFKDYTETEVIDVLDEATRGIDLPTGIHVCGRLSERLRDILFQTEFNVLDHEFYDIPENLDLFPRQTLEKHDKKISYGTISSKKLVAESVDEIEASMIKGMKKMGAENIQFFKPDCGFRGLGKESGSVTEKPYTICIEKIVNLKRAWEHLTKERRFRF